MEQEEYFFACPSCSEQISVLLDLSVPRQTFIEDCEVCCRALQIQYKTEESVIASFTVNKL